MTIDLFDGRSCALGEGPLWHPDAKRLYWFDILNRQLLAKDQSWAFPEMVSAAGWVDRDTLLIASESKLLTFNTETGARQTLTDLEADRDGTRSNDGRADPWGGFWIGTMSKTNAKDQGAIYRFYQGELRQIVAPLTIPNAICFAPDKSCAYFSDSAQAKIFRVALGPDGWLASEPVLFRDVSNENGGPDGCVVASDGTLWNAQWGGARVAVYSPEGRFMHAISFPPRHTSCPAFGGRDLKTLFVTSAQQGLPADVLSAEPANGQTFATETIISGLPENPVLL